MKYIFSTIMVVFTITSAYSQKSSLYVGLINRDTIYAEYSLKYKDPVFKSPYLELDQNLKIDADEVLFYNIDNNYYRKFTISYHVGPQFYERVMTGSRIEGYSKTVSTYMPGNPGYGGAPGYGSGFTPGSYTSSKVYYYSKDGGQLLKMNLKNLKWSLADNPESMLDLKKVQNKRVVSGVLYTVGAGMIIAAIASMVDSGPGDISESSGPKISPLFVAGAVTLSIPWLLRSGKTEHMKTAIRKYNRDK